MNKLLNYDNTLRVKKESDFLNKIGYLDYLLKQAQQECNKRNKEYRKSGYNNDFSFIDDRGCICYIDKFDYNMGQYLVYWIYKKQKHYTYMYKSQIEKFI